MTENKLIKEFEAKIKNQLLDLNMVSVIPKNFVPTGKKCIDYKSLNNHLQNEITKYMYQYIYE